MKSDLKAFAQYFYSLGFNVSCITNYNTPFNMKEGKRYKNPYHSNEHLFDERQNIDELNNYNWDKAVGLGTFLGTSMGNNNSNYLFALDIDGVSYNELLKILAIIGIPKTYDWIIRSGSKLGFHVYFRTNYKLNQNTISFGNRKFKCSGKVDPIHFNRMEFLSRSHIIMPPSLHGSSFEYEFINCHLPSELPKFCEWNSIVELIEEVCDGEEVVDAYGLEYFKGKELNSDLKISAKCKESIKYILLDIETTGLILGSNIPNLLQIAWYCIDDNYNVLKRDSLSIKNAENVINNAFAINNLTIKDLNTIGYDIKEALKSFYMDFLNCEKVLCYNTDFDIKIINHYLSINFDGAIIPESQTFCIMKRYSKMNNNASSIQTTISTDILNIFCLLQKCFISLYSQNENISPR